MKHLPSQRRREKRPYPSVIVRRFEAIFFIIALWGTTAWAAGQAPRQGDPLPEIRLTAPEQLPQRACLGLDRAGDFAIAEIRAEVLIIEIFSMYCPYCQKEAPRVNRLFETMVTRTGLN
jgi:hypothetical protein